MHTFLKSSQMNNLIFHVKKLEKKEEAKPNAGRKRAL